MSHAIDEMEKIEEVGVKSPSYMDHTLTQALLENNACYVLITCREASHDGQMEVEMMYEGDPVLAAYLVESASSMIDEDL